MDFSHLFEDLNSESNDTRIKAVQQLGKSQDTCVLPALKERLKIERVTHVAKSIERAIAKIESVRNITEQISPAEPAIISERKKIAHAVRDFSTIIRHEFNSQVGSLKKVAEKEVNDYQASRTKTVVDDIERLLEVLKTLGNATHEPKLTRFDLKKFLTRECSKIPLKQNKVYYSGPETCIVIGCEALLGVAFENGIRNAVEAMQIYSLEEPRLVISWDTTDIGAYVSIIDNGPGVKGPANHAFELGKTNKDGHFGFGLTIVKQAMESLNGEAILTSEPNGGAQLRLEWMYMSEN